jgi:hypothetical protein
MNQKVAQVLTDISSNNLWTWNREYGVSLIWTKKNKSLLIRRLKNESDIHMQELSTERKSPNARLQTAAKQGILSAE